MKQSSHVSLNQVSHHYGERAVLSDIDLTLEAGNTLALLGHNGAGKSTLIKIILGLVSPVAGMVNVLGCELNQKPSAAALQAYRAQIGYLPENISFYDKMTGREVLEYFAALKGVSASKVAHIIDEFGLGYAKDQPIKTYSKGMKQRLGFAQAIVAEPKLLLLDEPTVGLDPQASQFLYSKVAELSKAGCSIIVCTHELNLIEPHLDVAMLMGRGRCLAVGDLPSLMATEQLPVIIRVPGIGHWINAHPQLQPFYYQGELRCQLEQKTELVAYLASINQFEFTVKQPSLTDLYHNKVSQLQQCNDAGISFIESDSNALVDRSNASYGHTKANSSLTLGGAV
ncbi:ABC transporter ATP-binding protein [Shewanella maritima]|uniref:ABC transporter ATP-binding protein n=1 Tax=Shewanella maritima TaxID=2520507 RepID=A0A411PHH1_9GAMM|nr:ABC transporter ATP-binding protein [Shewanella maritima]QBF82993.1 ABC transporter ATP-binding protein [Shewanella maritima]